MGARARAAGGELSGGRAVHALLLWRRLPAPVRRLASPCVTPQTPLSTNFPPIHTRLNSKIEKPQGSFTQWRANNESFAALSALTRLTSLSLHAFHAASGALSGALLALARLRSLHLSGRVVVAPAEGLAGLGQLEHIDITQDLTVSGWPVLP